MKHEIKSSGSEVAAAWQIKKSNPPTFKVKWRNKERKKCVPGMLDAFHVRVLEH